MPDRAAAALANGLMTDLGHISAENLDDVIDHNKIRREKARICKGLVELKHKEHTRMTCIGFDGKRIFDVSPLFV